MTKIKKLAAVAAATVMAVSTMSICASAATKSNQVRGTSPYGDYVGTLSISGEAPGPRSVSANTVLLGSGSAPEIGVNLTIINNNTGDYVFGYANFNQNAGFVSYGASSQVTYPIIASSIHIVGDGNGNNWTAAQRLNG